MIPPSNVKLKIEVTVISENSETRPREFAVSGGLARTLLLLKSNLKKGLARIEALDKFGILSLSQHVHKLRHEYGLEIECEMVPHAGRDGGTQFGCYHLRSLISIRVISGGVAQ